MLQSCPNLQISVLERQLKILPLSLRDKGTILLKQGY
jgi:hypothetical protein